MKLVLAVVQDKDSNELQEMLVAAGFQATKLASTGSFLRSGNTTFLIGVDESRVERLLQLIQEQCSSRKQVVSPMTSFDGSAEGYVMHPIEVEVGGATVFVLSVDRFTHY